MKTSDLTSKPFECSVCYSEMLVDLARLDVKKPRAKCPHCNAVFGVDCDADFENGTWTDRTKLYRI